MKTTLKRLVAALATSALLFGGFASAATASPSTPTGKKPNVAINEYKNARAEFKASMKIYVEGKKANLADYRAALAAWKAANGAYLTAVKAVNDAYRATVKAAWRIAHDVLESDTATPEQKAAARAAFATAKAAAEATRTSALAALTPVGTPPVKPVKSEKPKNNDDDDDDKKSKPVESPRKYTPNKKQDN